MAHFLTDTTFAGGLTIPDYIDHTSDSGTKFGFSADDTFVVRTGGSTRLTVADAASTFSGDVQAAGLYVGAINTSFDFYNNGTSYFNGTVEVDDSLRQTGGAASSFSGDLTVGDEQMQPQTPISFYVLMEVVNLVTELVRRLEVILELVLQVL